ncbi:MAG: CCA tRNA nucleotidyltransferase [Firmicutes bacterium]|nr:CCA tRNA nucleotidyltransferase [Bacillota bacterium]
MTQRWRDQVPEPVRRLWALLHDSGVPVYMVGGAVRDLIRGEIPHDYDLASAKTPDQIMDWAGDHGWRSVPSGVRFGTVSLYEEADPSFLIEHTTLRREGRYGDSRHPDRVVWTTRIEEDLARRDFTFNAMAISWEGRLVDPFNGQYALEQGMVVAVGDPVERLSEDPLRMWRAARFAGMNRRGQALRLDAGLKRAMLLLWPELRRVSPERQRDELWRLLQQPHFPESLKIADSFGLFLPLWPEWGMTQGFNQRTPYHRYPLHQHLLQTAAQGPSPELRVAGLLHDIGKPWCYTLDPTGQGHFYGHDAVGAWHAERMMQRFHFSRRIISRVTDLVAHHMYPWERAGAKTLRRLNREWGEQHVAELWTLRKMDIMGTGIYDSWEAESDVRRRWYEAVGPEPEKVRLAVTGHDIMTWFDWPPGPKIGAWLRRIEEWVDEDPSVNDREKLKQRLLDEAKHQIEAPSRECSD